MASQSVVGFVGLVELSLELAASLLRSGYGVQAFETCSPLLDEFTKQGGISCTSPVEAGKDVIALVLLISHADQINDILFGHESALKGLQKDAVIILHSTILPAHIQKMIASGSSAMCEKLYVFDGEHGAGSKIKMVAELLEGIHFVASVEAISLGAQAGIHPWILYDIISNAAGNSW
ncbi:hypothetical protein C3L33_01029, partial [Rhododendron williamsianum]